MVVGFFSCNQIHFEKVQFHFYIKFRFYRGGIILMAIGEVGNFSAYAFAPASLVAPLGTSTVIGNYYYVK